MSLSPPARFIASWLLRGPSAMASKAHPASALERSHVTSLTADDMFCACFFQTRPGKRQGSEFVASRMPNLTTQFCIASGTVPNKKPDNRSMSLQICIAA
jgi:hypothetical protein